MSRLLIPEQSSDRSRLTPRDAVLIGARIRRVGAIAETMTVYRPRYRRDGDAVIYASLQHWQVALIATDKRWRAVAAFQPPGGASTLEVLDDAGPARSAPSEEVVAWGLAMFERSGLNRAMTDETWEMISRGLDLAHLDGLTARRTGFASMRAMLEDVGGSPSYRPTLIDQGETLTLAEVYDLLQDRRGDPRRSYRG